MRHASHTSSTSYIAFCKCANPQILKIKDGPVSIFLSSTGAFEEFDLISFKKLNDNKIKDLTIIGDDLTCTNIELVKNAKKKNAINGIIVKPNQCGTVSETINVINFCSFWLSKLLDMLLMYLF